MSALRGQDARANWPIKMLLAKVEFAVIECPGGESTRRANRKKIRLKFKMLDFLFACGCRTNKIFCRSRCYLHLYRLCRFGGKFAASVGFKDGL